MSQKPILVSSLELARLVAKSMDEKDTNLITEIMHHFTKWVGQCFKRLDGDSYTSAVCTLPIFGDFITHRLRDHTRFDFIPSTYMASETGISKTFDHQLDPDSTFKTEISLERLAQYCSISEMQIHNVLACIVKQIVSVFLFY